MKYSMLSVAAFVASSLASPAYFWDEPNKPGPITIDNKLNAPVRLDNLPINPDEFEVYGRSVDIQSGQSYTIREDEVLPSADLELSVVPGMPGQGAVHVKYRSLHVGPDSPFTYRITRDPHFAFPGVLDVQPRPKTPQPQCYRVVSFPNDHHIPLLPRCDAGTKLLITLCQQGHPDCPPGRNAEYHEAEWL